MGKFTIPVTEQIGIDREQLQIPNSRDYAAPIAMLELENRYANYNREHYGVPWQVQQYIEAGINPYMAVGQLQPNSGTSQPTSSFFPAAKSSPTDYANAIANAGSQTAASIQNAQVASAQAENLSSQAELHRIDAQTQNIRNLKSIGLSDKEIERLTLGNQYAADTMDANKRAAESAASIAETQAKDAARAYERNKFEDDLRYMYGQELTAKQIEYIDNQIEQIQAAIDNSTKLTSAQVGELAGRLAKSLEEALDLRQTRPARINNLQSQTDLNSSQTDLNYANMDSVRFNTGKDKSLFSATFGFVVNQARNASKISDYQFYDSKVNHWRNKRNFIMNSYPSWEVKSPFGSFGVNMHTND